MLLSGALFALFLTGLWLYCLTDAILTPASWCRGLPKRAWVVLIAVTFIGGALAWLIVRQPARDPARTVTPMPLYSTPDQGTAGSLHWTDADDAAARHPAGRGNLTGRPRVPKGPDDDPAFLHALGQAIRRNPPVS
jgi:hypothetical protein